MLATACTHRSAQEALMGDNTMRSGHASYDLQSRAESDQLAHEAERRHPSAEGPAAESRSLRAWLPLLAILAVGFVILLVLSLPS
jgi:hypothetical protein